MRKPVIAGNWKMHKTVNEAVSLVQQLAELVKGVTAVEVVVCPPFTALYAVRTVACGTNLRLGAQNMYWESQGAYTGEISPVMLKDVGCDYVIIGHSERRQYFGETDAMVNRKIKAALVHGLVPIVCVGENLDQREAEQTEAVVGTQVRLALAELAAADVARLVIAYEPVWAIGTGRAATARDANAVTRYIRGMVAQMYGEDKAQQLRILYGGSVKPENTGELMAQSDIDGALVGGASLDAGGFARIVRF